ncbi:hypothetical protein E6Q11_01740 [Candidatus Dojkabacteria bacterium]|uniref:Uncharacterized protein n=1 Tax=Candidatus Dojkabacteria bacterium TaxID=2099670 RepID=A0A5C7J9B4_9BACT|nr:MAG: hypothetical protein E6Q11_01740 [Candidatus Dojkabacteria bacterium]
MKNFSIVIPEHDIHIWNDILDKYGEQNPYMDSYDCDEFYLHDGANELEINKDNIQIFMFILTHVKLRARWLTVRNQLYKLAKKQALEAGLNEGDWLEGYTFVPQFH